MWVGHVGKPQSVSADGNMAFQTKQLILLAVICGAFLLLFFNSGRPAASSSELSALPSTSIIPHASTCPAACAAAARAPAKPRNSTYRVSAELRRRYVQQDKSIPWASSGGPGRHTIPGLTAAIVSKYQRQWKITGAVGEIGVHHGAFFLSLLATARGDELVWALDIFGQQQKNVDKSGEGDLAAFLGNVAALGVPKDQLIIKEGASTEYTTEELCTDVPQPFRLLSIDGGHTRDIVFSDMRFAECHLAEGGVVIMDDYTHPYWLGVHEGVIQYMHEYRNTTRLAPFFLGANKLYLTTQSHHQLFLKAMVQEPFWDKGCTTKPFCIEAPGKNGGTLAKFQLAGYGLAVTEHRGFDEKYTDEYWLQLLGSP